MLFQIEHHTTAAAGRMRLRHVALVHSVGELRQIAADLADEEATTLRDLGPIGPTSEGRLTGEWGELRFAALQDPQRDPGGGGNPAPSTREERRNTMNDVTDMWHPSSDGQVARDGTPALPIDESRLAMMRRIKRLPVAERIALLDRMCREQTQLAVGAHRVR